MTFRRFLLGQVLFTAALYLILLSEDASLPQHHHAVGQVIASQYNITNASRMIIAPGMPYMTKTFFTGNNATIIAIYPNYQFDGNSTGWGAGQIYVPTSVIIPLSYAAITNVARFSVTPPACDGGLLLYGFRGFGPVPNQSEIVNGATDVFIQGLTITNVDTASQQWKGTVEWQRPVGCPDTALFELQLSVGVLADVVDYTPLRITDPVTNTTLDTLVYGIAGPPRPFNSPPLQPLPFFAPICRGYMPYVIPPVNTTTYTQMFGSAIGPVDVPTGSVVYQVRFDGLGPDLQVHTHVRFIYPDDTVEETIIYPGFNNIYYVRSKGSVPALAYICYYTENCILQPVWNEVQLGYLAPCNCQPPSHNIPCNATFDLTNGPIARTAIPNFNTAEPFVPSPTCVFAVNPAGNGTSPIRNRPFQLQSLASGGAGPISYAWQLFNMPPSGGQIAMPTNTQTVTATVFAPTLVTIIHTVWTPSGIPQTCNQTIQVISGQPTACVVPVTLSTMPLGSTIGLDAGCSVSPDGSNITYAWLIAASPYPFNGGTLSAVSGPGVGFTCTLQGWYIIVVVVQNAIGSSSATSTIQCIIVPVPTPPSGGPVAPPSTPISCVTPLPPFAIPEQAPTAAPPIPIVPFPPGQMTPPELIPSPAQQPPTGFGPSSFTSESISFLIGVVVFSLSFLFFLMMVTMCRKSPWCCGDEYSKVE